MKCTSVLTASGRITVSGLRSIKLAAGSAADSAIRIPALLPKENPPFLSSCTTVAQDDHPSRSIAALSFSADPSPEALSTTTVRPPARYSTCVESERRQSMAKSAVR